MPAKFHELTSTASVRTARQRAYGDSTAAERASAPDALGPAEMDFIRERDSCYLATVSDTGWPYLQHRGGPPGFLHVIGPEALAFRRLLRQPAVALDGESQRERSHRALPDGLSAPATPDSPRPCADGRRPRSSRPGRATFGTGGASPHRAGVYDRSCLLRLELSPIHHTAIHDGGDPGVGKPLRRRIAELENQLAGRS